MNLDSLEYPRHLHKGEASCIVRSSDEARLALQDGFTVEYISADHARELALAAAVAPPSVDGKKAKK